MLLNFKESESILTINIHKFPWMLNLYIAGVSAYMYLYLDNIACLYT